MPSQDLQQHLKDMGLLELTFDKPKLPTYIAWKPTRKGEQPPF
jgi:hypothetical protein